MAILAVLLLLPLGAFAEEVSPFSEKRPVPRFLAPGVSFSWSETVFFGPAASMPPPPRESSRQMPISTQDLSLLATSAPVVALVPLEGGGSFSVVGPLARRGAFLLPLGPVAFEAPPSSHLPRPDFPDLTQTDRSLGLPLGGWVHCGPVAAADVLLSLDLVDDGAKTARLLGSRPFMDTRFLSGGTSPWRFLSGLDAFFDERALSGVVLEYQGWPSREWRHGFVPSPCWNDIALALASGGGAVLQVGWYVEERGQWRRRSGHWVALAGYDGETWFVADPGPWAGKTPALQSVRFAPVAEGVILVAEGNRMEGRAYREVLSGLARPRRGERAVAEGVVLLWRLPQNAASLRFLVEPKGSRIPPGAFALKALPPPASMEPCPSAETEKKGRSAPWR